jgi:hypothetical protein
MSWQIPTLIEQDIKSGKAQYRTFQTGNGGQSILPVPSNSYVVIFGYDFSPAGGGIKRITRIGATQSEGDYTFLSSSIIRFFETQQISFYTGTDFYPFIHHCDVKTTVTTAQTSNNVPPALNASLSLERIEEVDNTPIARQVYITSTNDVSITHGLILNASLATQNAIPVTNRTPLGLTYGGSGQVINTQTNYGPVGTPQQFMQPSPKDYQDFAFGLLPANADGQAFATPDTTNGLYDSSAYLLSIGGDAFVNAAAANYYLCLHYALYTETVPDSRG